MRLTVLSSPFGRALTVMIVTVLVTVPYTRVIDAPMMIVEAVLTAIALVLIAVLVRGITHRSRGAGRLPLTISAQLIVLLLLVTARGFARTAVLGFIPGLTTLIDIAVAFREAIRQIITGIAPLTGTVELHVLFIMGIGAFAIAMYALLVWSRSPVPASALTVIVAAIPSLVVGFAPSPVWFVALAVCVLVMFWQCGRGLGTKRLAGVGAAVTIGAGAVVVAVVSTQLTLPGVMSVPSSGRGGGYTIDASLNLGEDLRRPQPITALTYVTDGDAPYVRVATHTTFSGDEWVPDAGEVSPIVNPIPNPRLGVGEDETFTMAVEIEGARGDRLPVPYIPVSIDGLTDEWLMNLDNHTVTGPDISDVEYEVTYQSVEPTLEALRAAPVDRQVADPGAYALPNGTPPIIHETASRVMGSEATPIDGLLALERWFRSEFTYSLEPPIEDTANIDAMAAFLEVRSGYCTHFAATFATIARLMGLPTRVVVGFLPGEQVGTTAEGSRYRVSTDRLHAWPEVYFEGYGWIPFEPTATLGSETEFASTTEAEPDETEADQPEAAEDPLAEAETPDQPDREELVDPETGEALESEDEPREMNWTLLAVVLVVLLLCAPALVRGVQRAMRSGAARRGDALAGWSELAATVTDLGIGPEGTVTPRGLAEHLHEKYFIDRYALDALVAEVERAAFAPRDAASIRGAVGVRESGTLAPVMRDLQRNMGWWLWIRALFVPRSLFTGLQESILRDA